MHNFNYEKKFHYMVKYFVIAFPLLLVLVSMIFKDVNINFVQFSFQDLCGYLADQLNNDINSWYFNIISLLGFDTILDSYSYLTLLICYPLYIFWVYVFDLILDIFVFVPKLAHKLMYKLGGKL